MEGDRWDKEHTMQDKHECDRCEKLVCLLAQTVSGDFVCLDCAYALEAEYDLAQQGD